MPGRVWEINGETFYSPNSTRWPGCPPSNNSPTVEFIPKHSKAVHFQQPRWWSPETEWMAFVPRQPVFYAGVWFETLHNIPRRVPHLDSDRPEFQLAPNLANVWLEAERTVTDVTEHLVQENGLDCLCPFKPSVWGYHEVHKSHDAALQHILEGRDWFALWLGLLYWVTRRVPQSRTHVQGLQPEPWVIQLVRYTQKQPIIDLLRLNPLLSSEYRTDRVGVFLHHPDDVNGQPSAQWLAHQGVPVWYRWGMREELSKDRLCSALYLPDSVYLSNPFHPSPADTNVSYDTLGHNQNKYIAPIGWNFHEDQPMSSFTPTVPEPECEDTSFDEPDPAVVAAQAAEDSAKRWKARQVWEAFKQERACLRDRITQRENEILKGDDERKKAKVEADRRMRKGRRDNPTWKAAKVFEWEWDDNGDYVRKEVLKSQRQSTIQQYYNWGECIFDPVFYEWDCCAGFVPDCCGTPTSGASDAFTPEAELSMDTMNAEDVVDVVHDPGTEVMRDIIVKKPFLNITLDTFLGGDNAHNQVLDILVLFFGFVSPVPPPLVGSSIKTDQIKLFAAALGLDDIKPDNPFFQTPIGKLCVRFLHSFVRPELGKPLAECWDLGPSNWKALQYSNRLLSLRKVSNDKHVMLMLDLGTSATVPWKLAVYSASAALFICRLDSDLTEAEIAAELIASGIPFRTIQERETLPMAPNDPMLPEVAVRVLDHSFDFCDWEFYIKQCQSFSTHCRARAAILRGGFVWRIATEYITLAEVTRGPWGLHENPQHMFSVRDTAGIEYIDDELTDEECNFFCGMHLSYSNEERPPAQLSWFPSVSMFDKSRLNVGQWTKHAEELYQRRVQSVIHKPGGLENFRQPLSASKWRNRLKGHKESRNAFRQLEKWSNEFIAEHGEL